MQSFRDKINIDEVQGSSPKIFSRHIRSVVKKVDKCD